MRAPQSIAVTRGHTINERFRVYRGANVMSESWKRWEGQIVEGKFSLLRYLGGSDHSAVFLTERQQAGSPQKVAIKLVAVDPDSAESQLRRWKQSATLTHPNLVHIFECGRCELEGTPLLHVVMELAEEDLSQVLPERALSPAEVQQLLPSAIEALGYVHGSGLVHGRLRPSNILAAGDQVKISADSLRASEELMTSTGGMGGYDSPEASSGKLTSASDVWSLAITLVEVLTQHRPAWNPAQTGPPALPQGVPEPFLEMARQCLQVDPQQRWTIAQISARLRQGGIRPAKPPMSSETRVPSTGEHQRKRNKWLLPAIVVGIIVVALFAWLPREDRKPKISSPPQASEGQQPAQPASSSSSKPAPATHDPKPSPAARRETPAGESKTDAVVKGAVLNKVLPRVSSSSRETIEGKIKVLVRVEVDQSGKVTDARLVTPGPSKYFARHALEASREWTFTPPQVRGRAVGSKWNLRFGFRRTETEVVSEQSAP